MNKPLLTIIIPAYNVEKTIERAVTSVTGRKSTKCVEILIVNDGSKDGTKSLCELLIKKYSTDYTRIRLINKENGGHGSVINTGIKEAAGTYLKVLDGDDELSPEGLDELLEYLSKTKSDLVVSDYLEKYPNKQKITEWCKNDAFDNQDYDSIILDTTSYLLPCSTVKASVLKNANFSLDEKCFYDDQEYDFLIISKCKTISYLKKAVYIYYLGNPNQSVAEEGFIKNVKSHEKVCLRLIQEYYDIKDSLPENKRSFIFNEILIKLSHQQYRIAIYMKKSRKDFLSFDKQLKKYPELYNDYRVAGKKIKLKRLSRGVLI